MKFLGADSYSPKTEKVFFYHTGTKLFYSKTIVPKTGSC